MPLFGKTVVDDDGNAPESQHQQLLNQIASLRAEVRGLREERQGHKSAIELERQISKLTIDKDRIEEDNARKLRETTQIADLKVQRAEHEAGLLLSGQEQEIANARRQTELEVREGNLKAEKDQFRTQMTFREKHFDAEMARMSDGFREVLARLPEIHVELDGPASTTPRTPARAKAPAARKPAED